METVSGEVEIKIGGVVLGGNLIPPGPQRHGLVVFAHGSGSSRFSPRNNQVASVLREAGFGTLLFDLLTEKEDENYETRFDIELLTRRLERVTSWVSGKLQMKPLKIGYFGASTGAAAALRGAADLGEEVIGAVVSRGGRPDMAGVHLRRVFSPTLLLVGEMDPEVLEMNRTALKEIGAPVKKLVVIPKATHLFEEPGTLDLVAKHAAEWFSEHL